MRPRCACAPAHAGVVLSAAVKQQQLEDALQSRDVIGQAKGMLMARGEVTAEQAFDMLRRRRSG